MARSSRKRGGSKSKRREPSVKVRFIKSSSDRRAGSSRFIRLNDKDGEDKFIGHALFDPEPSEDNPGYTEFEQHWDNVSGRFIPCWGAENGCIFCRAGNQASTRALAAFLVSEIGGEALKEPEVKLFEMNWSVIKEWVDNFEEDGTTLGQKVRIKCLSRSDGEYSTKFFEKDRLAKGAIKAALKEVPDLEGEVQKNLNRALEALRVTAALEEDDEDEDADVDVEEDEDEEEEAAPKKKRGRPSKKKDVEEDEDEDEDEEEDDEEEEEEDEETDEEDDDEEDDEEDEDEEEEDEEDEEEDEDEDEDDEGEEVTGQYKIVSVNSAEMNFSMEGLDSNLYLSQDIIDDVDFDDYKKGETIEIEAAKDADGDWVATSFTKAAKKRGRPKGSSNKKTEKKSTKKKKKK